MGWISDVGDSIKDAVSSIGDVFSDPIGAFGDILEGALNFMTFGTYQFAKDAIGGLFDIQIPYQDRTRMVRAAAGSRQIVYGRALVGGQLAYIESWYNDRQFLTMTIIVAAHQVEEITAVYANDRKIASARSSGNGAMPIVIDGKYNTGSGDNIKAFCWSADGTQTSWIAPTLTPGGVSRNPPGWTSAHKLLGMAYVHVAFWYDKDRFESGLPKIKVEVKGKNDIYDPRTGTTGYTDNQALCTLDALRWDRLMNVPDADIDMDAFAAAANIADQSVAAANGGTDKRYTVNGTIPIDRPPLEVVTGLSAAGAGIPVYTQGKWTYVPGAYTEPVMTLDESDLVGGMTWQPGPPKRSRHNKATGTYIDAAQNFEEVEFSQLLISSYVEDDLEELEKTYQFPFTNSGTMARRLAKIDIERNRFGVTVQMVCKYKTLRLTPGDRVWLNNEKNGWNNKIFRVEDVEFDFSSGVALTLREDAAEIYDWEEGDALALDPPPAIQIPDGLNISAPLNLSATDELYRTLTRTAVKVRLIPTWEAPSEAAIAYDVQFKLSSSEAWVNAATYWQDTSIEIDDVQDLSYDIRVRSINVLGNKSDWTQITYQVIGKSELPPDVPLLFVEKGNLKWIYRDEPLDLAGFLVRFQNGDRRFWADATPMHEGIVTETVFDVSEFNGVKTFLVKAVDTTGNESANAAVVVQNLGDAPVDNVIQTQNEFPGWTDVSRDFSFAVRTNGETESLHVVSGGVDEDFLVSSTASYTGAFINGDGYLEAQEIGSFYGDPDSIFYSPDPDSDFYGTEYQRVEYQWTFEVLAADAGADLTVEVVLSNGFNQRVDYIPPNYTGNKLAFPGQVAAEEGVYTFLLAIPQQQATTAPIIQDIITRLDVGDIEERLGDVVLAAGGTRLPITKGYREIVVVNLTLQDDGGTATRIKIIDKDATLGPLVQAFDDTGTGVSATIDALIQGY